MTHRKKNHPETDEVELAEPAAFAELGLSPRVLSAVRRVEFKEPSPIQAEFIPAALTGRDCIGRARTGTGKTAAFLLPLFEYYFRGEQIKALVLAPTRELAQQITTEANRLSGKYPPNAVSVYGGQPMKKQIVHLRQNPDIVVATPGRVIDHYKRNNIAFHSFSVVICDEVDRMFDMGFRKDINYILGKCSNRRQTLLLSATMPEDIMRLARRFTQDPINISTVTDENPSVASVKQSYVSVKPNRKSSLLEKVLKHEDPELGIIFTRTKATADRVAKWLTGKGVEVKAIHGDLMQRQREQRLDRFRCGKLKLLVATDVMGRGIDVPGVSHVINYDIPENPEDYLHRIGRSGRMDRPGKAITFVTPDQGNELTNIEMLCNLLIDQEKYEDM
ncbi:MAG: DEAD/DEAH box helicase [Planctomycetota bacterium]|jgi:ATP-dependent RNA helicase DeaD